MGFANLLQKTGTGKQHTTEQTNLWLKTRFKCMDRTKAQTEPIDTFLVLASVKIYLTKGEIS